MGVDLATEMLAAARSNAAAAYDELRQGDAVQLLTAAPAASVGLILAADVLIYVGALTPPCPNHNLNPHRSLNPHSESEPQSQLQKQPSALPPPQPQRKHD